MLKITTYTREKLKVETTFKEIYQQSLGFITIGELKIEQPNPSDEYIITLPMNKNHQ